VHGGNAAAPERRAVHSCPLLLLAAGLTGASSLDFFVYTFTKTTVWERFHEIKQDVLLQIGAIIERNGAEIAFPSSTVHLQMDPGEIKRMR
jgi:MscS family membrane protein